MVENFTPQPYPLECSSDGTVWFLVLGWTRLDGGQLTPMLASSGDGVPFTAGNPQDLRYRIVASSSRPSMTSVRPSMAPSRSSRS